MTTRYRLPKLINGTRWDFSLDLVDVEETEPAVLTIASTEYPAIITDGAYNWTIDVDLPHGEHDYQINTSVNLLYGLVEVV